MVVSIVPQESPNATPMPRPILGYSRTTGELVALVPSCSQPNVYHVTTATCCSCRGFQFRGRCRHVTQPEPLPCSDLPHLSPHGR